MYKYLVICLILVGCKDTNSKFSRPFYSKVTIDLSKANITPGSVIYLEQIDLRGESIKIDSFKKSGNVFQINKKFHEPFQAIVTTKSKNKFSTFLSPMFMVTDDSISIKLNNAKDPVSGGENEFYKKNLPYHNLPIILDRFQIENQLNEEGTIPRNNSQYKLWSIYENRTYKWVADNSENYYTIMKLYDMRLFLSDLTMRKCLAALKENFENTKTYNLLEVYLQTKKKIRVGGKFTDIPIPIVDTNMNTVRFKNIYHPNKKIYIIDFWASWCGPCRLQARKLNKNYSQLDTTKIQLISVSIDRKVEDWKKANYQENYPWKSYMINKNLDQGNIQSVVSYIPTYFVLDSNKNIIGRYSSIDSISHLKFSK